MKKLKKILSAALALCMLSSMPASAAKVSGTKDKTLKFNSDGKFTIMQIADMQDRDGFKKITLDFIKDMVNEVKPDLVVLTGDNIGSGTSPDARALKSIDTFMSMFEKLDVKVAAVFGNHDDESTPATKEMQMAKYMEYDCFVGCPGDENIAGVGNYNLPVLSSDGTKTAFNIWCIDSGNYNDENDLGGYGCVHKDQIEWYKATSNALKEANGGEPVYSLSFQHIIVPEIYEALKEVEKGTEGAIENDGKYYVLPDTAGEGDSMHEAPCPPKYNNGQFDAWLEQGDVLAHVVGHDHINDFVIPYKGIDLICTPSAGFRSYGDSTRGVRVFTIDENDTSKYETKVINYLEYYKDNELALTRYKVFAPETSDAQKVLYFIKYSFLKIMSIFGC